MAQFNLRHKIQRRISILRRCILRIWYRILGCSLGKPIGYSMLSHPTMSSPLSSPPIVDGGFASGNVNPMCHNHQDKDSDLVALKICLLGDCRIGKTSFLVSLVYLFILYIYNFNVSLYVTKWYWYSFWCLLKAKYVGNEKEEGGILKNGLNLMGKTMIVKGARISYSLWEVDGMLIS